MNKKGFERNQVQNDFVTRSEEAVNSPFGSTGFRHRQRSAVNSSRPFDLTDWGNREIARRRLLIRKFDEMVARGRSRLRAARKLRTGATTIWRWKRRLAPLTALCGRKSVASKFLFSCELLSRVEALQLAGMTNATAWRRMAKEPECPPDIADFLRTAKALPPSFLRLTKVRRIKLTALIGRNFLHLKTNEC